MILIQQLNKNNNKMNSTQEIIPDKTNIVDLENCIKGMVASLVHDSCTLSVDSVQVNKYAFSDHTFLTIKFKCLYSHNRDNIGYGHSKKRSCTVEVETELEYLPQDLKDLYSIIEPLIKSFTYGAY